MIDLDTGLIARLVVAAMIGSCLLGGAVVGLIWWGLG